MVVDASLYGLNRVRLDKNVFVVELLDNKGCEGLFVEGNDKLDDRWFAVGSAA
jgi:hypothetical protein